MAVEVKKDGGFVLVEDSTSGVVNESFALRDIKSVDFISIPGHNIVKIVFVEDSKPYLEIDLSKVTNQATWTDNTAGLIQAVTDIKSWYLTEVTTGQNSGQGILLGAILAEMQKQKDFEMLKVRDANGDIFALRATFNETSGTYSYDYIDAQGNVAIPVNPLEFLNPDNLLTLIYQSLLPIQGTDTPDIIELSGISTVNLPAGCKGYTVVPHAGTITHDNGTNVRTLIRYGFSYSFDLELDRNFGAVTIAGTDATAEATILTVY